MSEQLVSAPRYTLLDTMDYVRDLVAAIKSAKRSINMIALVIREDDDTRPIIDALCEASRRGVNVSIGTDVYFTYKELGARVSRLGYLRQQLRDMRNTKRRLEAAGATVRWLGAFGATFISHRTHIKWSIIDDTVYCFCGVNIYDAAFVNNDFMLKAENKRLAERLRTEHELVLAADKIHRSYPSHSISIDGTDIIHIDGGRLFNSLIYKRACTLAEEAKHTIYVSQYCPTGRLARILRRKKSQVFYNSWQNVEGWWDSTLIRLSMFFSKIPTLYTKQQYLHAKFILFYMDDGSVVTITGSHNFTSGNELAGAREVALETRTPHTIQQLEKFLRDVVVGK
ncbi:hypothetical protein EOL96_08415 [Candidatus Saccharibacteria bacterium]|nr:hypothetical protein [Candidatus Saccharibacteria bacterium]